MKDDQSDQKGGESKRVRDNEHLNEQYWAMTVCDKEKNEQAKLFVDAQKRLADIGILKIIGKWG